MRALGVTAELKSEHPQYWGRTLGRCFEDLVAVAARTHAPDDVRPAPVLAGTRPADVVVGDCALEVKYRLGSGDGKTIKTIARSACSLADTGLRPVMVVLRADSNPSAISGCRRGGWDVLEADQAFEFLAEMLGGFRLDAWLASLDPGQLLFR